MDVYHYAGNNPIKLKDQEGKWAIWDDITFAVGGAIIGLAAQGVQDMLSGNISGGENYIASGIGGAVGGWALLYTGPVAASASGAAISNAISQGIKLKIGKQKEFDVGDFAIETTMGALLGKLPGVKEKGVTIGRGSVNSIYKQMTTKLKDGTIKSIKPRTTIKMFKGRIKDTAAIEGQWVNSIANAAKERIKDEKK